ncbi:TerD family protein [Pseudoalteromonas sp. SWXJZ94C]|uniref:TerD family protein n=1 Tax=unclassified Pseudoalteromonas TaxID=194690 RepID=UPI00140E1792|nr:MULTISPECIES: TerD family protein [unclassified Pseudoalteromonas]MBH0058753.1 TerD family protein [Pseudoalteromonas sp. SWXJZ94C]
MALVVGQNILIEKIGCVEVNFAWRSLKSDLNLAIHAVAFSNGAVLAESPVDPKKWTQPDAVNQDNSGRHFTIQFPQLASKVDRIAFYGFLPENSHYSLKQMSHFQIRVNDLSLGRLAKMDVQAFNETHKGVLLFEFYKHNNMWKLGYKSLPLKTSYLTTLTQLGIRFIKSAASGDSKAASMPQHEESEVETVTHPLNNSFIDNVELKKGQNLSLSEHFNHCSAITCKLNVVPKIDDLALNVVAINRDNKVNNIKDFLYHENTILRGEGVKLDDSEISINIDLLPSDVTKIQILVTRRASSKRINSADFIELSLSNTYTEQKMAKYVCETTDKNYNTMVLLNFYRHHKGWSIRAVGQGFSTGLEKIGERYQFSPPKLRYVPPQAPLSSISLEQEIAAFEAENKTAVDKHKKMQSLSYMLMGIAALLVLLTFSRLLFLPLACLLGGLGWYLFQRASKALKAIQDERFERLVLNMIKGNNYQLTPFDIATHCRVNIERATEMLDKLCGQGLGHTAINREGAIFYDFSSLKNSTR